MTAVNEDGSITWDAAIASGGKYVKFEEGKKKRLLLTNTALVVNDADAKVAAGEISFRADVIEEDGVKSEKKLEVNSNRLKERLRPLFENKAPDAKTEIIVTRLGDGYQTQYIVDVGAPQ